MPADTQRSKQPTRPFTIAIAGGSGSGKTSLTRAIVDVLGAARCAVLDHDSYYRDLSHQPISVRAAANFDHPDSLENDLLARQLADLQAGRAIDRPRYDFSRHTRMPSVERVEPRPVVICEGILLLAISELRAAFDLRVYVDTPADVRALRRLQRDVVERGRTMESVIKQYLDTVRPMHERYVEPARRSADVVLDWRQSAVEQARAVLKNMHDRLDGEAIAVSG